MNNITIPRFLIINHLVMICFNLLLIIDDIKCIIDYYSTLFIAILLFFLNIY